MCWNDWRKLNRWLKKGDTVIALMGGMGRNFNGSYEEYALLPIKNVFKIDTFSKLVDITDEKKRFIRKIF